jgi:hypothetical protein
MKPPACDDGISRTTADPDQRQDNADRLTTGGGLVNDERHTDRGKERQADKRERNAFRQEQASQDEDEQGLERPQEDREARRDVGQPGEAERVCDARVQDAKPSQVLRTAAQRLTRCPHQDDQDDQAGRNLDGQEGERRNLLDGALADHCPDAPRGGGQREQEGFPPRDRPP